MISVVYQRNGVGVFVVGYGFDVVRGRARFDFVEKVKDVNEQNHDGRYPAHLEAHALGAFLSSECVVKGSLFETVKSLLRQQTTWSGTATHRHQESKHRHKQQRSE